VGHPGLHHTFCWKWVCIKTSNQIIKSLLKSIQLNKNSLAVLAPSLITIIDSYCLSLLSIGHPTQQVSLLNLLLTLKLMNRVMTNYETVYSSNGQMYHIRNRCLPMIVMAANCRPFSFLVRRKVIVLLLWLIVTTEYFVVGIAFSDTLSPRQIGLSMFGLV